MKRNAPGSTSVLLRCPLCGREISLLAAEGPPAGLSRLDVPCPDCEGHHVKDENVRSGPRPDLHALRSASMRFTGASANTTKESTWLNGY